MLPKVRIIACKASFPCVLRQDRELKRILVLGHNTSESCWVTLYSEEYDVSDLFSSKSQTLLMNIQEAINP